MRSSTVANDRSTTFFLSKLTIRQLFWAIPIGLAVFGLYAFQTGMFAAQDNFEPSLEEEITRLPVNVQLVERVESFKQKRSYSGDVRARNTSELAFELPGRIVEILVSEGDVVQKGDVLAVLDKETLLAQQSASQAQLRSSFARLSELNAGPRMETINAARKRADAIKSQLEIAQLNLKRRERLRRSDAISQEDYDQAVYAVRTAKANYGAASDQLSELLAGTRVEQVNAQKSIVAQNEASLNEIKVALSKCQLIAPFDGTVTQRYIDPGTVATQTQPVIKLVEHQHLEAWIGLPVSVSSRLNVGDSRPIIVNSETYAGEVSTKIAELDMSTRTQRVVFNLSQEATGVVVPGQLCEVQIESINKTAGFWLPTSSLSKGVRGLWSVLALRQDEEGYRVEKRDIEIISVEDSRVLARGTLVEGDRIVIDGVHRVAENQLVIPN